LSGDDIWAELADDAETLARLHDRELDAPALAALRGIGFPDNLALLPPTPEDQQAWQAMAAALAYYIPDEPAAADLDALAAEYAATYLTGAYNVSPCESFWLDEDRLHCQQPMLDLRAVYAAAGLAAADWRKRPDDHLVLQLQYIAHALRRTPFAAADLARMMDAHLLRWLPDFAGGIARRAALPCYAALARLTLAWCRVLRSHLAAAG
jgi:TorA maturation chaperone TorD